MLGTRGKDCASRKRTIPDMEGRLVRLPHWLESLLLGHQSRLQRVWWFALLLGLLLLVPASDVLMGRSHFHVNLYPLPVVLSIFLFGEAGLISILIVLVLYHTVQLRMGLEAHATLVNNLAQLGVTFVIGMVCCWLVSSYRALYREKANLAVSRHQLLLNLTHEIRSPLFAVRGIVRNLARNLHKLSPDQVVQQLHDAQAAIASVNQDVEGLTQVFRADLKEVEPRFEAVDRRELVGDVLRRHPVEFRPSHTLVERYDEAEDILVCDRLLTLQLLDNLVSNCLRHTSEGEVSIAVEHVKDEVRFQVQDQGPGILPADRERIFGRFERGSLSSASGFGVGLYLVEVYAQVQGGRVEVDDVPTGASFSLYLPNKVVS